MDSLYNKKNKKQLLEQLHNEQFKRITLSFYRYTALENLIELRDQLYAQLTELNILGRIYIAEEGINAQLSLPENSLDNLKNLLNQMGFIFTDEDVKEVLKRKISRRKPGQRPKKSFVNRGKLK